MIRSTPTLRSERLNQTAPAPADALAAATGFRLEPSQVALFGGEAGVAALAAFYARDPFPAESITASQLERVWAQLMTVPPSVRAVVAKQLLERQAPRMTDEAYDFLKLEVGDLYDLDSKRWTREGKPEERVLVGGALRWRPAERTSLGKDLRYAAATLARAKFEASPEGRRQQRKEQDAARERAQRGSRYEDMARFWGRDTTSWPAEAKDFARNGYGPGLSREERNARIAFGPGTLARRQIANIVAEQGARQRAGAVPISTGGYGLPPAAPAPVSFEPARHVSPAPSALPNLDDGGPDLVGRWIAGVDRDFERIVQW